jgi:MFS family permease
MDSKNKLGGKVWLTVILFGLFGQVAWIVENMYFNVFIDRTLSTNAFAVAIMVAASAIVATFATLIGGTMSDKLGMRKHFMSVGYIVWGVTIMAFALIKNEYIESVFGCSKETAILIAIAVVVIMDCVMTYIGSTANDAAFNAWITDNTTSQNRGKIEGVLAFMPLIAMAVVFGALDGLTQDTYQNPITMETQKGWVEGWTKIATGNWTAFFLILGSIVILAGIVGIFTIKDSPKLMPSQTATFKDMFYGFKKEVIVKNKYLYLTYASLMLVNIASNSFLTYLIMYIERTLGFAAYIIPVAIIIVLSGVVSVVYGIFMDKAADRRKFMLPLVCIYIVGAIAMLFASPLIFETGSTGLLVAVCIAGTVLMGANLCNAATMNSTMRDLTPIDKVGLFQGVRMFFLVLVPMCIGPMITAIININSPIIAADAVNGIEIREYTYYMFIVTAVVSSLAILPILKLKKASLAEMHPFEGEDNSAESKE